MTEHARPREVIAVDNLVQSLGGQEILRGFSLKVYQGETLVLLGRSGGGKSVFLRHLIGLMQPIGGTITVDGLNITELKERDLAKVRRSMGMLFQNGALFDSMTVADNVAFPLRERGETDEGLIARKVDESLRMVNLHGQQQKMPVNLSGGMRKRVALARALINEPRCMLYDEPTAGLDPIVADSIDVLIRRLQRRLGVTSIVVTHDMKSAFAIADHVALLHEGRCYFYGTCDQLRASTDPVIRDFVEGRSHEEP
jgi:phospholipid/cholesterol/gamma-HCH transport system ATP-binding protein